MYFVFSHKSRGNNIFPQAMEFSERSRWYDLRRHWTGSGVARRTNIKIVLRFARYTARTVYNTTASTAVVRRRQRILLCACAFRATTLTEVIPRIHDSQRCQISTPTSCRLDRPSCSDDFFFFFAEEPNAPFYAPGPVFGANYLPVVYSIVFCPPKRDCSSKRVKR